MHTCRSTQQDNIVCAVVCESYQSTVAFRDSNFHKCSERQVISKHIHVGFDTAWLLLALIEFMQTDFPLLSKSAVCKAFSLAKLARAMATMCLRRKKGRHSSRAVAVNVHIAFLKQDPEKQPDAHMLISIYVLSHKKANARQKEKLHHDHFCTVE